MTKEQLGLRALATQSKIDSRRLRNGQLQESDWPKLIRAANILSEASIFIDDTPSISVLEMRSACRRLAAQNNLSLIVVDYLQLMRATYARSESREKEISEISRGLKALAKELSVPVIALSQLNRSVDSRPDKRPMLSDLRESGAIEQDADVIMFIYRDEVYHKDTEQKGIAELIVGKQRNGPTGTCYLTWLDKFTTFENHTHAVSTTGPRAGDVFSQPPPPPGEIPPDMDF
jgi:replicative DNA helicase